METWSLFLIYGDMSHRVTFDEVHELMTHP